MAVQARFFVDTITQYGRYDQTKVELAPVTGGRIPGNADWSKFTPSGKIELNITNPDAAAWFASMLGKDIAITFEERPEDESA